MFMSYQILTGTKHNGARSLDGLLPHTPMRLRDTIVAVKQDQKRLGYLGNAYSYGRSRI